MPSRRFFIGSAATAAIGPFTLSARASAATVQPQQILSLFDRLPGDKAIKIWAPATDSNPELLISPNASPQLFVGSAIKTFVLAVALIRSDAPDDVKAITTPRLALDASVWSPDSPTFNPPNLTGTVSERTAMEAIITHSDNTGTDMMLKYVGPDNVRSFIASAGLKKTAIPDSTRSFFGYLLGASDYKTFTWAEIEAAGPLPIVNFPLNSVSTLASSADDFVSCYSRALQGRFFKNPQTLNEFRRILTLGGVIFLLPLPLGGRAFCKGGSIDVPGFHCVCAPGGLFFNNRWVYFAFVINWYAPAETDPNAAAAFAGAASEAMTIAFNALSA
jgi:beta-lactamase class A